MNGKPIRLLLALLLGMSGLVGCSRKSPETLDKQRKSEWEDNQRKAETTLPSVIQAIREATWFEIVSIDPPYGDPIHAPEDEGRPPAMKPYLQWKEWGRTPVTDAGQVRALSSLLQQDLKATDLVSFCMFNPRHAVRAHAPGGREIDLVICYQCGEFSVFEKGRELFWPQSLTGASAKGLLDQHLDEAHVMRSDPERGRRWLEEWLRTHPQASEKK